jgi:hypothetical protein
LDQAIDDRTAEQRVFLQREANQDSPSLTEMIRYLVESIRTTETRREEVLATIEADSDFMLRRLQSREAELQACLLDSARAKTDAILAGQHKSIPPPVSLKSPLLYTFFPGAGTVGAWNQVEYTATINAKVTLGKMPSRPYVSIATLCSLIKLFRTTVHSARPITVL